jgi:tetratricopeptide (TPR) repeat protein
LAVDEWTPGQAIVRFLGVLGIGAFVTAYFAGLLNALLPSPARLLRWLKSLFVTRAPGTHFTVLIADLEGDDERFSQTSRIEAALDGHEGLEVVRIGSGPRLAELGSRTERQLAAERLARAKLDDKNGDVLIFGEVAEANQRLRLRFVARHESLRGQARSYALEAAELPKDFGADFNAALLAWVAASVAPATEHAGQYVADLLKPAAGKLQHLCAQMPDGLDADQRGNLVHSFALAASVLGEQTGESGWLDQAVAAYRAALEEFTCEHAPLNWAAAQTNLGSALSMLGEREDGASDAGRGRLEEAVVAFGAALEVFTRERFPLYWAMTQTNLGNTLRALGEREKAPEKGIEWLKRSAAAFGEALEVWTRHRFPLHWAMTLTARGSALTKLGEREGGTARLEQAVVAHCAALLEVLTRERLPLDWARAQNNLGNALQLLGDRQGSTKRLQEALAAYDNALLELTRERVPLQWAVTQFNRGDALRALGELESGTGRLEEAVRAIGAALEVFRKTGTSYYVRITEASLGRSEALLAKRQGRSTAD